MIIYRLTKIWRALDRRIKKYVFNNFTECIKEIAYTNVFNKRETKSYFEQEFDGIYLVNFLDDNGNILFSKTVIENLQDKSCILSGYYEFFMNWREAI